MSFSKWAYTPEVCDGGGCPGDCDLCDKPKNMEDEDDITGYIKREDVIEAMAQYLMNIALIDKPEASDRIEQWESNVVAPIMSTVKAANVVEVVRCEDCKYHNTDDCFMIYGKKMNRNLFDDDYCSYGEREEA